MKNIWNKIPAWLKAIVLNFILLFPMLILVQNSVNINLTSNASWGWALLVIIPVLFIFWILVNKWNPFKGPEDVQLELTFNPKDSKNWYRMVALILITVSAVQLFFIAFKVENTLQIEYFEQFRAYGPLVTIPLLLGLALNAGIVEEVIYRGFIQNTLMSAYPKWLALLGVGALFVFAHFLPLPLILAYFLVSTAFSLVADELKSTGVGLIAHVVVDFLLFLNFYYEAIDLLSPDSIHLGIFGFLIGIYLLFKESSFHFSNKKQMSYQV